MEKTLFSVRIFCVRSRFRFHVFVLLWCNGAISLESPRVYNGTKHISQFFNEFEKAKISSICNLLTNIMQTIKRDHTIPKNNNQSKHGDERSCKRNTQFFLKLLMVVLCLVFTMEAEEVSEK